MGDSLDVCRCWPDWGNLAFCPSCFFVAPKPCREDVSPAWSRSLILSSLCSTL